jgi:hypothetical protein
MHFSILYLATDDVSMHTCLDNQSVSAEIDRLLRSRVDAVVVFKRVFCAPNQTQIPDFHAAVGPVTRQSEDSQKYKLCTRLYVTSDAEITDRNVKLVWL